MIMVGKIKTPTEKDPKGKIKRRACPKGFKQRDGHNYDADDSYAPVIWTRRHSEPCSASPTLVTPTSARPT